MSTLKTSNIQDTSGGNNSTPEEINQGRAKAWITLKHDESPLGTGLDSFNVGSITDNGTGDFTITFANAMPNANYAVIGMVANTSNNFSTEQAAADRGPSAMHLKGSTAPTTTAFNVQTRYGSSGTHAGANFDFSRMYVVVFGD
tara:strand:- start:259 stop:690 length:432 start_codon:yes stop_codon:yes gene_type:complete